MSKVINVHYDSKPLYDITIEKSYDRLGEVLHKLGTENHKLCIVSDSHVAPLYLDGVAGIAEKYADKVISFVFPAGEQSKNLDVVGDLYEKLIINHFDRKDTLIALGGGVVGDLTGYAAATYLRGIRVIQLPTSLLAMVDSSIGGKTGVDFRGYKNMIGAFHQPSAVYMNLSALLSLTDKQYYSGFGEIIKHGLIKDMGYFKYLNDNLEMIKEKNLDTLEHIVYGSCEIKRKVVENDPKEKGERALLNFGHTLGHAIEKLEDFTMLHGECVSVGMIAAGYISMNRGMISREDYDTLINMIKTLNLPAKISNLEAKRIIEVSKSDKKMDAGQIRFILLDKMGNAVITSDVTDDEMTESLNQVLDV